MICQQQKFSDSELGKSDSCKSNSEWEKVTDTDSPQSTLCPAIVYVCIGMSKGSISINICACSICKNDAHKF